MLFPVLYKLLAAAGIAATLVVGAYLKGRSDANANCRAAELQSQIKALQKDVEIQRDAAAFEAAQVIELQTENERMDKEIDLYVKKLAERPQDSRCSLSDDDVRLLDNRPR